MPATFRFFEFFRVFFQFFPLKLFYFWTKSRKNIYGCFFHSFCATDLKFGTKNIRSMKLSILKTLIFASYWDSVPSQCYRYQKTILQRLIFLQKRSLCQLYKLKRHNRNLVTLRALYCVVYTSYELGRSLGDCRTPLPNGQKYKMVKTQTENHVRIPVVWTNRG